MFLELGLAGSGSLLAPSVRAMTGAEPRGAAKACISIFLAGGPSQIDTWDPKPGRPTGGPFRAIETSVPGIRVAEHLPNLAARAHRLAIVRSLVGTEPSHDRAIHLMRTSYPPQRGTGYPPLFGLFARHEPTRLVPASVVIGGQGYDPGLLGRAHAPLTVGNPRSAASRFRPVTKVAPQRQALRLQRWRDREDRFAAAFGGDELLARREIFEEAIAMLEGENRTLFDIAKEPPTVRERYGEGRFADACVLARRLVEGGVPFVEITHGGWDTHADNFPKVERRSRELDQGLATLLDELDDRGLLEQTLIVCMGEFGRTPKINANGGRDHYPKVTSAVLAGGGIGGGQVIGATDEDGMAITERPIAMQDLLRTVAVRLGVDPDETHVTDTGRPIANIDGGTVVPELAAR
jgi:hypothetical protein